MTSAKDRELVIGAFDGARYPTLPSGVPGAPTLETAWLGIAQVLLWYEHGFLHIREANDLKKRPWQAKATAAEQYIANQLGVDSAEVPKLVDRMMKLDRWSGMQRNNPLGHGLRMLVSEVLERWGNAAYDYPEEEKPAIYFPGIVLTGRSERASIDVLARHRETGAPRAIISCKWSIRHDRISDPTNECTEYKGAAIKRQNMNLFYCVVTNELDGQRLDKIITQPCVDALVHVHLPLALQLNAGGTTLMAEARARNRLLDLTDLVHLTATW